ncbi:MAG: sigma-70 family RNA polymerase sigma factor [Prolixibacteraceae bacterium]
MSNNKHSGDKTLAALLVQGNIDAFDDIYWKYQRAIYLNSFRITRDEVIAQDIVQEVFISLWEKRQSINPDLPLAGWLFVSSYNRSLNILKKKLRESVAIDQLTSEDIMTDIATDIPEKQLLILEAAIDLLSPQKRRVFELCKLQGKSYEEAAKEMQISKNTVKEYLSEAIMIIKEYARQHPVFFLALSIGVLSEIF